MSEWRKETALKGCAELDEIIDMYKFAEKQFPYTNLRAPQTVSILECSNLLS